MSTFRQAVVREANKTFTENGMPALKSSLNANVDLFFAIGASRGKDVTQQFAAALEEDREMALRCLLWVRDIRGGSGERQTFRSILQWLEKNDEAALLDIFHLIPEMGRWDDYLIFQTPTWQQAAFTMVAKGLEDGNGLCAKWMPRKGKEAMALREFLEWSPKFYRKTLVNLSNTVEQRMCAREWDAIDFGKLPSVASARYQKAFAKQCGTRYEAYKAALANGEAKINAGAVYPYDVVKSAERGDAVVAQAQWDALPNYMQDGQGILPVVDVSQSMDCAVGGNANLSCMDVALSLGMYIADKQQGPFSGIFVSFTDAAEIGVLPKGGTLVQKKRAMTRRVGYSTNVQAVFRSVLKVARDGNVKQEDMPKYVLMLSDMQFDGGQVGGRDVGSFEMARRMFADAGYELPKLIYWNLNARGDNTPVEFNQQGVALVSGFSPSLMQSILGAKQVTPVDIMRETLMKDRYNIYTA